MRMTTLKAALSTLFLLALTVSAATAQTLVESISYTRVGEDATDWSNQEWEDFVQERYDFQVANPVLEEEVGPLTVTDTTGSFQITKRFTGRNAGFTEFLGGRLSSGASGENLIQLRADNGIDFQTTYDPSFLGSVRTGPFWYFSPWVGFFNLQFFPWIYLPDENAWWFVYSGPGFNSYSGDFLYFDHSAGAWKWMNEDTWPAFYNFATGKWE